MNRLKPINRNTSKKVVTTVNITEDLMELLDAEVVRINSSGRSETIRLILEEYFKEV